jgi:hypothetical protein
MIGRFLSQDRASVKRVPPLDSSIPPLRQNKPRRFEPQLAGALQIQLKRGRVAQLYRCGGFFRFGAPVSRGARGI